jgi:S-formylglutathione hydrolase FrmB
MRQFKCACGIICLLCLAVAAGRVERLSFKSAVLGKTIKYVVVLPNTYDRQRSTGARFPVLYLLHGAGGRAWDWTSRDYGAQVDAFIDSVHYIIAAPDDGNELSWWLDSPVKKKSNYHTFLVSEFKHLIDSLYATLPDRNNTGVAGHSMGGYGALHNLIESPDVFSAAYSIKGAVDLLTCPGKFGLNDVLGKLETHRENWVNMDIVTNICKLTGKNVAIRFYSGPNDWFNTANRRLDSALTSCAIPHGYVLNDQAHRQVPFESMKAVMLFFDSTFTRK